ncbi:MAG TPA: TMEM175 family protein [Polyangiaceae bacterium]
MSKGRLEAFSDGVIAILITIMVLELKVPHDADWRALREMLPTFASYALSFVLVAIYWNNHHHMLHMTKRINGRILWANNHLLFWLSLVPFCTAWHGDHLGTTVPTALYAGVLFMCGIAYTILQNAIIRDQGAGSPLQAAVGNDRKGLASAALYTTAIAAAFVRPWISDTLFVVVALMWLVPDRRLESRLTDSSSR